MGFIHGMELNSGQNKALEIGQGALLILAGPGTGKTRVIVSKILKKVSSGISPERILAMTFSNKATLEMSERLAKENPQAASLVEVSTIHSWCQEIVRRHGFRLGFQKDPKLMSAAQSILFFHQMASKLPLEPFLKTANSEAVASKVLQVISKAKEEGLWPEDLIRYGTKNNDAEWEALGDIYNAYQSHCFQKGFLDFGDVILFALRLLQDFPEVRKEVNASYDMILVDEFQDTNWTQIELLKRMAGEKTHVCVVGDDDQAIYRFRGASYSAFQFFKEAFPRFQLVELNQTYRLSPAICNAATTLIRANGIHRFDPDKKLIAQSDKGGPVRVLQFNSHEDEAHRVAADIEKLLREGVLAKEIGVLVRSHKSGELFLSECHRRGIPVQSMTSEALFEIPLIQDILSILRLIQNPQSSVDLIRLFDSPFLNLSEEDIYSFCRWAAPQRSAWFDLIPKIPEGLMNAESHRSLLNFEKDFHSFKAHAYRKPLSETLLDIWEGTGVVQKLMENDSDSLRSLAQFHSQIFEWEKTQDRRDAISLLPLLENLFENESAFEITAEVDPQKISLLTIHASKGLEFDHVFILGLVGRRFPTNFQKPTWEIPEGLRRDDPLTKEAHIEEERRLLYVAMTRARKDLILTTVERKGTKPSLYLSADLQIPLKDSKDLNWEVVPPLPTEKLFVPVERRPLSRVKPITTAPAPTQSPLNLSFTQLDRYEKCPRAFWFEFDLKIPPAPSPVLGFGAAVHQALERFYKDVKDEKKPSKENLIAYFEKEFNDEAVANPLLESRHLELGKTQLAAYYDFFGGKFSKPIAIEERFKFSVGPHTIVGKIDRADTEPDGIRIIDYKTGESKSSEDDDDQKFADQSLQFSIYALAAKEFFKWPLKELCFHYLKDNEVLKTQRDVSSLESTKEKILEIAGGIQHKDFPPKPNKILCRTCTYRKICPSAA